MTLFTLYAVRNSDGYWFHAKGYGGYGATWTDDASKAKLYTKLGQARARVTYFASHWPAFPAPQIVKFGACEVGIVDESARLPKVLARKATQKEREDVRRKKREFENATRALDEAKARLAAAGAA